MTAADLFAQLAAELSGEHGSLPGVARRRMFGRAGLSVHGKFFAFLNADRLVLKLPAATATALLASGAARPATDLSPTMRHWVSVPAPDAIYRWRQLLHEAHAHTAARSND
jgi:TfoX/Sxy family transcriptional regulator of competence genes